MTADQDKNAQRSAFKLLRLITEVSVKLPCLQILKHMIPLQALIKSIKGKHYFEIPTEGYPRHLQNHQVTPNYPHHNHGQGSA